jgi:hypothetical protein
MPTRQQAARDFDRALPVPKTSNALTAVMSGITDVIKSTSEYGRGCEHLN